MDQNASLTVPGESVWKTGYERQPTLNRHTLFFETGACALYLDLSNFFHAILIIWPSPKQTGKCHSPFETFQCKMHKAQGNGMWSMADTQK